MALWQISKGQGIPTGMTNSVIAKDLSPVSAVPTSFLAGYLGDVVNHVAVVDGLRVCGDIVGNRYNAKGFNTIFDPNMAISISDIRGSSVSTPNDGSVPVTSALAQARSYITIQPPNRRPDLARPVARWVFYGRAHSSGIASLFFGWDGRSVLPSKVPHLVDGAREVVDHVRMLLHAPVGSGWYEKK